jgi:hypothetical protein
VTRAELAAILERLSGGGDGGLGASGAAGGNGGLGVSDVPGGDGGIGAAGAAGAPDVPGGAWYEAAVLRAAEAGTLLAGEGGALRPTEAATRAEAAYALARAFRPPTYYEPSLVVKFSDHRAIPAWALHPVYDLANAGYVLGDPSGAFRPGGGLTRAEIVTIADRMEAAGLAAGAAAPSPAAAATEAQGRARAAALAGGFTSAPLPDSVLARVVGASWKEGCPVPLDGLRYLRLAYVDFSGDVRLGEMVVNALVADDAVAAFREMFEAGFPIARMELIDDFGADDEESCRADNTSCFCYRTSTGSSTTLSNHAYGLAIDINPVENPYKHDGQVSDPAAAPYLDRGDERPGMVVAGGLVYEAFVSRGWEWGGDWTNPVDWQHFEKPSLKGAGGPAA